MESSMGALKPLERQYRAEYIPFEMSRQSWSKNRKLHPLELFLAVSQIERRRTKTNADPPIITGGRCGGLSVAINAINLVVVAQCDVRPKEQIAKNSI
jgi:hypothetical protein